MAGEAEKIHDYSSDEVDLTLQSMDSSLNLDDRVNFLQSDLQFCDGEMQYNTVNHTKLQSY
jgi:hypothetical protein